MESLFEQLGGTYTRQGDYCLPDVCLPPEEERPIGIYGQRRRAYLKEHHRVLYYNLLTAGTLDGPPRVTSSEQAAGNCIWVTSKRGSMTFACFVCRKEQCCFETTLFRTLLTLFFYSGIMYL